MALRVSAAKLAASLQPKNGPAAEGASEDDQDLASEAQDWSDLELARRIAHILGLRHDELRREELLAKGYDVEKYGLPVDNTDWAAFLKRIQESL